MSSTSEENITEALDSGYYLWQVSGKSPAVRLSLDFVDRLRSQIVAKFSDLTTRGAEIGGILLGHVDEPSKTVFVDSYESIECDYTDSAMFSLSEATKVRLVERLYDVRITSGLSKYFPVGFFRTHARKGMVPDERDLALMREYFPDSDNILLLIKPFATKPSLGAIFIRRDGEFQTEPSGQFPFKRAELAVRTPECIVGTAVTSNGSSGSVEPATPQPLSAPPLANEAAPGTRPVQTRGAGPGTADDEQDELRKILRQILRNPAETKLFTSPAAEQDSTIWARIASLPGAAASYASGSETGMFGEALKTAQLQEASAKGLHDQTPEPEGPKATASALDAGNGADTFRQTFIDAQRKHAERRHWQVSGFAAAGLIILSLAGYLGVRSRQHPKSAATQPSTEDAKLNLSFNRDGKGLVLHWDDASAIIASAKQAVLHIRDGNRSQDLTLAPDQLHSGTIVYFPLNKDARFQLEVVNSSESHTLGDWLQPAVQRPVALHDKKARQSPFASETIAAAMKPQTGLPASTHGAADRKAPQKELTVQDTERVQGAAAKSARKPAKLLQTTLPTYPEAARLAHASGLVSVQGVVGTDGRVKSAVALSGPPVLRNAAVDAVEHFVYQPATVGGQSTESVVKVTFNFVPVR